MLKKLLTGPIQFTPVRDGDKRYYTLKAPIGLDRLLAGTVGATMVASPTGSDAICSALWPVDVVRVLRAA